MKHRMTGKKLGRTTLQRASLIKNQIRSLFTYGSIKTTFPKAVALNRLAEKYCHQVVLANLTSRRALYDLLQDRHWVKRVETGLVQAFPNYNLNFLRIVIIGNRKGDDAQMAKVSFVRPVTFQKVSEKPVKKEVKPKKTLKKKND